LLFCRQTERVCYQEKRERQLLQRVGVKLVVGKLWALFHFLLGLTTLVGREVRYSYSSALVAWDKA